MAQLELTNQKVDCLSHESTAKKSDGEKYFMAQIVALETQLQESSRSNHEYKKRAEESDQIVREAQQELSMCRMDLDRARFKSQEAE